MTIDITESLWRLLGQGVLASDLSRCHRMELDRLRWLYPEILMYSNSGVPNWKAGGMSPGTGTNPSGRYKLVPGTRVRFISNLFRIQVLVTKATWDYMHAHEGDAVNQLPKAVAMELSWIRACSPKALNCKHDDGNWSTEILLPRVTLNHSGFYRFDPSAEPVFIDTYEASAAITASRALITFMRENEGMPASDMPATLLKELTHLRRFKPEALQFLSWDNEGWCYIDSSMGRDLNPRARYRFDPALPLNPVDGVYVNDVPVPSPVPAPVTMATRSGEPSGDDKLDPVKVSDELLAYIGPDTGVRAGALSRDLRMELNQLRSREPCMLEYQINARTWGVIVTPGSTAADNYWYRLRRDIRMLPRAVAKTGDRGEYYVYVEAHYALGVAYFTGSGDCASVLNWKCADFIGFEGFKGFEQELARGKFVPVPDPAYGRVLRVRLLHT